MFFLLWQDINNRIAALGARTMESQLYRGAMLALYQFSLLLGIVLLPVALVVRQAGITLPIHRMIARLGDAYENAAEEPA